VLSVVVKIDKRDFVEKSPKDRPVADKVFSTFRLQTAPKMVQIFPILGREFCAKLAANRQLGTLHAHRLDRVLKINGLHVKSTIKCLCLAIDVGCAARLPRLV
jgi:hypothetical protein